MSYCNVKSKCSTKHKVKDAPFEAGAMKCFAFLHEKITFKRLSK